VERVVCLWVIEGRLQDSRWKNDLVELRIVVSVYSRRRHAPLSLIDRLTDLAKVALELEFTSGNRVVVVRSASDLKRLVVTPLVGISNLTNVSVQLGDCFLARLITHPTE